MSNLFLRLINIFLKLIFVACVWHYISTKPFGVSDCIFYILLQMKRRIGRRYLLLLVLDTVNYKSNKHAKGVYKNNAYADCSVVQVLFM